MILSFGDFADDAGVRGQVRCCVFKHVVGRGHELFLVVLANKKRRHESESEDAIGREEPHQSRIRIWMGGGHKAAAAAIDLFKIYSNMRQLYFLIVNILVKKIVFEMRNLMAK